MTTKLIPFLALVLASAGSFAAAAEATTNSDYAAVEQAAKEAEAAVTPLKDVLQKADVAYAKASKEAHAKRLRATDTKNLAGDPGAKELKQAETNLAGAVRAVSDATDAKAALDKALADAKSAALLLQRAYDAAEKAAKGAEAGAKAAFNAANKLDEEAGKATAEAEAKRKAVVNAAATKASAAAEKAAQDAAKSAEEKKRAAAQTTAKRKAAVDAAVALAQARQSEQESQHRAAAVAQMLADAKAQVRSILS